MQQKRIVSAFFVAILLLGFTFSASAAKEAEAFIDVTSETEYRADIMRLQRSRVVGGNGAGAFGATRLITPAEAITILERTFGNPANLPDAWSGWQNGGEGYSGTWFDASIIYGNYLGRGVSRNLGASMILTLLDIRQLPANLYDIPPELVNSSTGAYTTFIAYGFPPQVTSASELALGMTRAEFCNLVVWASDNLSRTIPAPPVQPIVTVLIEGVADPYLADVVSLQIQSSLAYLPEGLLRDYARRGYTVEFKSSEIYKRYVSSKHSSTHSSAAIYCHDYGDGGKIVTSNTNARTIIHEMGHYVQYHASRDSAIQRLFAIADELAGVAVCSGRDYCRTNYKEFFAEAFYCYITMPDRLALNAPQTYQLIEAIVLRYM